MSRIMNLRTSMIFCPVCGCCYSWNIQTCPMCAQRAEAARKAALEESAPVVVGVSETQANIAALYGAAAEAGVTAEWLTPQQIAHATNDEMTRIAQDAMAHQDQI